MAFKTIQVELTEEQVTRVQKAVGRGGGNYALLAEPELDKKVLNIQVCTVEQFEILRPAILKAAELPQWKGKRL